MYFSISSRFVFKKILSLLRGIFFLEFFTKKQNISINKV